MRWARWAALAAVLMIGAAPVSGLQGCSSDASPPAAAESSSGTIGAVGGSVTTPSGSGVAIPGGAVASSITVTVNATASAPAPSQGVEVGTPYTFGPEGQQFSVPVTVTLAFDPARVPAGKTARQIVVFTAPLGVAEYTPLPTTVIDATHVAAPTMHFSVFVAVVPEPSSAEDAGAPGEDGGAIESTDSGSQPDATVGHDAGSESPDATTASDSGAPTPDGSSQGGDATAGDDSGGSPDASGSPDGSGPSSLYGACARQGSFGWPCSTPNALDPTDCTDPDYPYCFGGGQGSWCTTACDGDAGLAQCLVGVPDAGTGDAAGEGCIPEACNAKGYCK